MTEFYKDRKIILNDTVNKINLNHKNTIGVLENVNPKYAKHMFLRNQLIENFAKHIGGGIDILDQPVCTRCEKPCAWNEGGSAYCFSCNNTIPADKTITVLTYLMDHTKSFTEEQLEMLNLLGGESY